jgi:hypothetical protein
MVEGLASRYVQDRQRVSELDIGYPESPLTVKNGYVHNGPKSGERWPNRLPPGAAGARFTVLGPRRWGRWRKSSPG